MRISDWSSDVCSSDLPIIHQPQIATAGEDIVARVMRIAAEREPCAHIGPGGGHHLHQPHCTGTAGDRVTATHREPGAFHAHDRSEEHTSELQSLMRISCAVFCFKKKKCYLFYITRTLHRQRAIARPDQ